MTAITQLTRFKSDKTEEMVKNARAAKIIFEKHGAEFLRLSRFHTGVWAGEWLVVLATPVGLHMAKRRTDYRRTRTSQG
jgi:hypothetical protein